MNARERKNPDAAVKKYRARIRHLEAALVQALRNLKDSESSSHRIVVLSLKHWLSPLDQRKVDES